jgi:hypothetical protein
MPVFYHHLSLLKIKKMFYLFILLCSHFIHFESDCLQREGKVWPTLPVLEKTYVESGAIPIKNKE